MGMGLVLGALATKWTRTWASKYGITHLVFEHQENRLSALYRQVSYASFERSPPANLSLQPPTDGDDPDETSGIALLNGQKAMNGLKLQDFEAFQNKARQSIDSFSSL